ncbi:hypothetical protein AVEN_97423-1 [Araneus ventricosus]|uniref:Uncharacterized protein n=1 Tax=Araneus ventricosus TaxID=182803 RepID=A0A4Y2EMT1_ARAVE|nr:hypothetical protein AVEN_97423-1 [Araneus ventricosus]
MSHDKGGVWHLLLVTATLDYVGLELEIGLSCNIWGWVVSGLPGENSPRFCLRDSVESRDHDKGEMCHLLLIAPDESVFMAYIKEQEMI